MTEDRMKEAYRQSPHKKQINREVKILCECGAEYFYIETGCHVNDEQALDILRAFAMKDLGYISSDEFYGLT